MDEMDDLAAPNIVDGLDPRQLFSKGLDLGTMDLIQGGSFREVIGRVIMCLIMMRDKDDNYPFAGISIIFPPNTATKLTQESVWNALASGAKYLRGKTLSSKELELFRAKIKVINCISLDVADVLSVIRDECRGHFIAIAESNKYKDSNVVLPQVFGVSRALTSEDIWTPHVTSLCQQCIFEIKKMNGYAVVHVESIPALKEENIYQLMSVDDCYVAQCRYENDIEEIVNQKLSSWVSLALRGDIAKALAEINELDLSEFERHILSAQLHFRIGNHQQVLEKIEALRSYFSSMTAAQLTQLSRMAYKAGDELLAAELLPKDLDDVSEEMWLEEALELATLLQDNARIERFDFRFSTMFPGSERLRENRDRRLLANCRIKAIDENYRFTTAGFTDFHWKLFNSISLATPNYKETIELAGSWSNEWRELAEICCAVHAWSEGQLRYVVDLAHPLTTSNLYGRQAAQVLMSSMRSMMLKESIPSDKRDYYRKPLFAAIQFLAKHPDDNILRAKFSSLLSVNSCGDIGIPVLTVTMLDIASEGMKISKSEKKIPQPDSATSPDNTKILEIIEKSFNWLNTQETNEFGVTVLPEHLAEGYANHIIRYNLHFISSLNLQGNQNLDLASLERIVLLICALCPHSTTQKNDDLRAMRILASRYAISGQFQRARDLAEHTLLMAQVNDTRKRLAWLAFADIYHRCNNYVEALTGLASAFAIDTEIKQEDLWQEIYITVRTLRDLGLFAIAEKFLHALKELSSDLGYNPDSDLRIVSIELGLRLKKLRINDHEEIRKLCADLSQSCEKAVEEGFELFPLVLLLAQLERKAVEAGVSMSSGTQQTLEKSLSLIGEEASHIVKALSSDIPTIDSVVEIYNRTQSSNYAVDIASDYLMVEVAARRLLSDSPGYMPSVENQAFSIELLADRSVELFDKSVAIEIDWPISYSSMLNNLGLDVAFLAVNNSGELVVIHVSEGKAILIPQPKQEMPFRQRLLRWLDDYPKKYGYIDSALGCNEFYTTMEILNVRLPNPKFLLIVAEPLMQQLTPNITLTSSELNAFDEFLGVGTGVGMVPSLTWLSVIRGRVRSPNYKYKAWISVQDPSGGSGPLDIVFTRLNDTLNDFGFAIDTGQRLPRDMSGVGLAVVAAHGGLTVDGKYIHSIRDEGGLIESPLALANALEGIEVVILFVCSGGRIDKHPVDNTTVGLPRQLLDKGSRAVVASPWPLDVKVTYRWLEPFLQEWEAGSTILRATKKANEAVANALGNSPEYSQAMSVYGDVLLTRQSSQG